MTIHSIHPYATVQTKRKKIASVRNVEPRKKSEHEAQFIIRGGVNNAKTGTAKISAGFT